MSPSDWHLRHKELTEAGLIVQTSAVQKIEKLQSLIPLIEAANSSGVRLLDGNTVEAVVAEWMANNKDRWGTWIN